MRGYPAMRIESRESHTLLIARPACAVFFEVCGVLLFMLLARPGRGAMKLA